MYESRFDPRFRPLARGMGMACLAAAAALLIVACGGAGRGSQWSPLGLIHQPSRTVQLNLVITPGGFDGYSGGALKMNVPRGWRVDVFCSNQTATPHSCAIVSGAGSRAPAFPGAASPHAGTGLPRGEFADFGFTVKRVGSYRLTTLVPGHQDRWMWDRFEVVAGGEPSVSTAATTGHRPSRA
ncbi:MAG: hypothetical protein J2P38_02055 [Candidatus Dormibacteraeota bacterium]|nr:hypothetical protein [Candidatus Dormibacteraeota bacterium]